MYLKPRITYTGISSGHSITINVRWYTPDGTVSRGEGSPSGYSLSQSIYVQSGEDNITTLSGWGNQTKGNWKKGKYRFEIWYGNVCLRSKTFTIY